MPRCPGNIGGGKNSHDARHGQSGRHVDRIDLRSRVFAEHHPAVQHARNAHVIDERPFAERLLESAITGRGIADSESISISLAVPISVSVLAFCVRRVAAQSEIFAEIGMAAGFLARQLSAIFPCFAGGLNRVHESAHNQCSGRDVRPALALQPRDHPCSLAATWKKRAPQFPECRSRTALRLPARTLRPSTSRISSGTPSSVTTSRPSICSGFRRQDSAGRPSTRTAQQPHVPSGAQPFLGETMPHFLAQNFEEVHPRLIGASGAFTVQSKAEFRHRRGHYSKKIELGHCLNYTLLLARNKPVRFTTAGQAPISGKDGCAHCRQA